MVDFSDVVTYDAVSARLLEKPSSSAAEEAPTLWDLAVGAVGHLSEFYSVDQDDFVPTVLAVAMPTLQECQTTLNPSGKMDLVEQGIWGKPYRGQRTHGLRTAARDVARGNADEWMLASFVEDSEGNPLGVLDGLLEGVDLWDSIVAADLEHQALATIDDHIARAQAAEALAIGWAQENLTEPSTKAQRAFLAKQGYDADEVAKLTEGEAHQLIFGKDWERAGLLHRMAADRIKTALDEYLSHIPEPELEPTPNFIYEPTRPDEVGARVLEATKIAACAALESFLAKNPKALPFRRALYRVLVRGGKFRDDEQEIIKAVWAKRKWGDHHWRLGNIIPGAKAAKRANAGDVGFPQILEEALAAERMAEQSLSEEAEGHHCPMYLVPEYEYSDESVAYAVSQVTRHTPEIVVEMQAWTERIHIAWRAMRVAFSTAWNGGFDQKKQLWDRYRELRAVYFATRDLALEGVAELTTEIPAEFTSRLSPTELAGFCNALAAEVGAQFGLIREASADALDVLIEDEDVWGRLYPEGWTGEVYDSLLPGRNPAAVTAFAALATNRVYPADLTFHYWDHQVARQAHVATAISRCHRMAANNAGSRAFWAQQDARAIMALHRKAVQGAALQRSLVKEVDGRWVRAKSWRNENGEWENERGAVWRTVDADFNVLNDDALEAYQIYDEAAAENKRRDLVRVVLVDSLHPQGIRSNGTFVHWKDLAQQLGDTLRLEFESPEKKTSFVGVVSSRIKDADAQRVVQLLM